MRWLIVSLSLMIAGCSSEPTSSVMNGGNGGHAAAIAVPDGGHGGVGGAGGSDPCARDDVPGALLGQIAVAASGEESLDAVAVAEDGSMYGALSYDQALVVGDTSLPAPDAGDVVVIGVEADQASALHRIAGAGLQQVSHMAARSSGLFVLGRLAGAGSLEIDDVAQPGFGADDAFVIQFGDSMQLHRLSATGALTVHDMYVDSLGVWLAASFSGSATLYQGEDTRATVDGVVGVQNGLVVRITDDAAFLQPFGPRPELSDGSEDVVARAIIGYDSGALVFGDFSGAIAIGQGDYQAMNRDFWVSRVKEDATIADRAHWDGSGDEYAVDIAFAGNNRVHLIGTHTSAIDFGGVDAPLGPVGIAIGSLRLSDTKLTGAIGISDAGASLLPRAAAQNPGADRGLMLVGQLQGDSFALLGDAMTNLDTAPDGFVLALDDVLDPMYGWHVSNAELVGADAARCQFAAVAGRADDGSTARHLGRDELTPIDDAAGSDAFSLRLAQ